MPLESPSEPENGVHHPQLGGLKDREESTRRNIDEILRGDESDNQLLRRWTEGAGRYKRFVEHLASLSCPRMTRSREAELQALFLGEKPAVLGIALWLPTDAIPELRRVGLETAGDYLYDPRLVEQVLDTYGDEMMGLPTLDAKRFMDALTAAPLSQMSMQRGLVLGIPKTSVKAYGFARSLQIHAVGERLLNLVEEGSPDHIILVDGYFGDREDKQGIMRCFERNLRSHAVPLKLSADEIHLLIDELSYILRASEVDIRGIRWIDYEPSLESYRKQRRLEAAFEYSALEVSSAGCP